MWLLYVGIGVFVLMLIVTIGFIAYLRSQGTVVVHPESEGELDYDGLEDKEFLCRNCGEPIDPYDDECMECGAQFEMEFECQYCGEMIDDPRELVCPSCGEALITEVSVCPGCNSVVNNEATHCEVCGDDFWSPIFLSPRKVPKFNPPEYPEEEEEGGEGGEEEEEEETTEQVGSPYRRY
jgi:hypothetical protein